MCDEARYKQHKENQEICKYIKINTLLNNRWVKEFTKQMTKCFETNENTAYQIYDL